MKVCLSKQDTEGFYILWGGGEDEYEYQVGSMDGSWLPLQSVI